MSGGLVAEAEDQVAFRLREIAREGLICRTITPHEF